MRLQVTGIRKRGSHNNPHERIEALAGPGWGPKSELTVIAELKATPPTNTYFVMVRGHETEVIVAHRDGREYLKTIADGYAPDNLLALPEV